MCEGGVIRPDISPQTSRMSLLRNMFYGYAKIHEREVTAARCSSSRT